MNKGRNVQCQIVLPDNNKLSYEWRSPQLYTQLCSCEKKAWKKFWGSCKGFEPLTSAIPAQRSAPISVQRFFIAYITDLHSHNSLLRSSHIWFSYIHYFNNKLYSEEMLPLLTENQWLRNIKKTLRSQVCNRVWESNGMSWTAIGWVFCDIFQ